MADVKQLQAILQDAEKLGEVKKAVGKLSGLLDKVGEAQKDLNKLIGGKAPISKPKSAKDDHPNPKSQPLELCKVMGATPMTAAEIAKKVGKSEATVKLYLYKFRCFQNVRGKGYTYTKPTTTTTKKKTTKKKSKKKS